MVVSLHYPHRVSGPQSGFLPDALILDEHEAGRRHKLLLSATEDDQVVMVVLVGVRVERPVFTSCQPSARSTALLTLSVSM